MRSNAQPAKNKAPSFSSSGFLEGPDFFQFVRLVDERIAVAQIAHVIGKDVSLNPRGRVQERSDVSALDVVTDKPAFKKYFMHGLGHPLGLDVHDIGFTTEPMQPGWVMTIEPAIYAQLKGKHKMLIGLGNDEIGYVIPKRQWDEKPPFCYGLKKAQYGESNSTGPDTAPILCEAFKALVNERK